MALLKEIPVLLKKELMLEWRQRSALNGIILYVVSTVFVCFMSFSLKKGQLTPATWNALFWIILLFTAVNAVAKSFMQERYGRFVYYYSVCSPQAIIISKMIYNALLMLILSALAFGFYALVMDNPVQDMGMFILNLLLGSLGFAGSLTLISGIASKTNNGNTLMAIMSFPVVIPMLLMLIRVSKSAIDGLDQSLSFDEIGVLLVINAIVGVLSYVLFPYLWRS